MDEHKIDQAAFDTDMMERTRDDVADYLRLLELEQRKTVTIDLNNSGLEASQADKTNLDTRPPGVKASKGGLGSPERAKATGR